MALLLIITVLSLTWSMVNCESDVTGCDAPLDNTTCTQGSCLQPPCMMHCGLMTSYDICQQTCNSSCDSVKCTASQVCRQRCSTGNCKSMTCDSQNCFQRCESATCGLITCVKNAKSPTSCEQSSTSGEMICENEICDQNCGNGNCTLTCSSNVKRCTQTCDGGNCQYKCEAQDCKLSCAGGSCTEIKHTNRGHCLQMTASVGLAFTFALVAFM